jgi:hypothetical protein
MTPVGPRRHADSVIGFSAVAGNVDALVNNAASTADGG